MEAPESKSPDRIVELLKSFSAALLVLMIIFVGFLFLSFPLGAYAFYNGNLSTSSIEPIIKDIPIFVVGLPLDFPARTSFGDLFAFLWSIYLILFVIALNGPYLSLPEVFRKLSKGKTLKVSENAIVATILTFTSVTLITGIIERLQTNVGISSGSLPEVDPLQTFTGIALAPITEEIGFRVSTIGLIAFVMLLGKANLTYALKAFWHPERYLGNPVLGRTRNLQMIYAVTILSGVLFGLAHILFGAGWQVGKFTTSSIAGIALGLLYVKVGLPAAVLMHWSFNYYRSSYYYFEQAVGNIMIQQIMEILLIVIGAMSIAYLVLARASMRAISPVS